MGALIIADNQIGINKDGLYCLNDMHKAAMAIGVATESQRPGNFVLSQADFISAVDATGIASIKAVKGGKTQGTWASEIVAMKYAGWLDPAYEVQVYQAVQALKHGDIESAVAKSVGAQLKAGRAILLEPKRQGRTEGYCTSRQGIR